MPSLLSKLNGLTINCPRAVEIHGANGIGIRFEGRLTTGLITIFYAGNKYKYDCKKSEINPLIDKLIATTNDIGADFLGTSVLTGAEIIRLPSDWGFRVLSLKTQYFLIDLDKA